MTEVGQVMARVGIPQATALRVEDAIEARDKHVGWDVCEENLVCLRQSLPRRRTHLGYGAKHTLGCGHNKCCWHAVARGISDDHSEAPVFQFEEVVEVSTYLPRRLVVGSKLPAF